MSSAKGRPAPPGRPRNSQARSVSSYSLPRHQKDVPVQSLPSSISALGDNLNDNEDEEARTTMTSSETVRGLGLDLVSEGSTLNASAGTTHEFSLEDVEHALRDLTRDDLVLALKRAKEQMDILDTKLESHVERSETLEAALGEYASQVTVLENDKQGLQFALSHREERVDELLREQERMEEEVYRKSQVNERLRKQLDESERVRADAERRYAEQSATADKERQSYLDMEKLLQTQKTKAAGALERTQTANQQLTRQNDRLQQKVIQLQQYVSPLRPRTSQGASKTEDGSVTSALDDSSGSEDDRKDGPSPGPGAKEVRNVENEERLSELDSLQNELATLRNSQSTLTATLQHLQTELRDIKATNIDLRMQNETFVDLLHEKTINGELITESAMLNRQYSTIGHDSDTSNEAETTETETETSEADDEDDVPDVPSKRNRGKSLRRRNNHQLLQSVPQSDLASELESSDPNVAGRRDGRRRERTRERSEMLSNNVEDLQKEVWDLRDANQALTLYVNKILDRIISREGYENVLAIDGDQKRSLRGKASRLRPAQSASASPESKVAKSPGVANRASGMGFLGLRRSGEEPLSPGSPTTPTASSANALQTKAKRASSMDWRSFFPTVGGGGASPSPNPTTDAGIRIGDARRIRSSEEKEDKQDEEERERIRQQLLREGIVLPEHQLKPQLQQNKRASSGLGTFFSRVIGTAEPAATDSLTTTSDTSIIKKDEQHPGPRVATFDGQGRVAVRSPLGITANKVLSDVGHNSETDTLSKADQRQRALDQGGTGNLTEAPARRSIMDSRRGTRRSIGGSSSGGGDGAANSAALSPAISRTSDRSSRGPSEAGDESYFYQSSRGEVSSSSPAVSPAIDATLKVSSVPGTDEEAPTWRKALKRMSLLGSGGGGATAASTASASGSSPSESSRS